MVGEYLIVGVEITFALHENGPGDRVKIIEGMNESLMHGFLQAQERGRRDRNSPVSQRIEKIYKHNYNLNRAI
jgi:hypothetical protein